MAEFGSEQEVATAIKESVEKAIPGAQVEVSIGGGAHYSVRAVSSEFEGKGLLAKQRMVLTAIAHLLDGHPAPVHAIDKIEAVVPS